jgi:hypothetical protein
MKDLRCRGWEVLLQLLRVSCDDTALLRDGSVFVAPVTLSLTAVNKYQFFTRSESGPKYLGFQYQKSAYERGVF